MTTFGWDASHYDDPPAARDGIDFYTHKLTDGDHFYLDSEYQAAMNAARAVGVPVLGAYHVLHGQRDLSAQAAWMIERADALTPWWRTWPYWIWQMDCEPFGYNVRPTVAECNAFGHELVRQSGRPVNAVEGYLPAWSYGSDVRALEFPWWQSSYVAGSGAYRTLYPGDASARWTAAGRRADFLQYTSSAVIAGQTTCDANAFVGTLADLMTFIGGSAPPPGSGGNDMPGLFAITGAVEIYVSDSQTKRHITSQAALDSIRAAWPGIGPIVRVADQAALNAAAGADWLPPSSGGGIPVLIDHTHAVATTVTGSGSGTTGSPIPAP